MTNAPHKRPLGITILIWGISIGALINIWRAWAITEQSLLFQTFDFTIPLLINLIVALLAVVGFLGLGIMVGQGQPKTRILLPAFLTLYTTYQLASKWLWGATIQGWQMWIGLYVVSILFTLWVCWQPKNKHYWQTKQNDKW